MAQRIDCNKKTCLTRRCKDARKCACQVCGPLKNISNTLYESCIDVCQNAPRPTTMESYLCDTVSPQVLYSRYGLELCGFSAPSSGPNQGAPLVPPVTMPLPTYPQPTSPIPKPPLTTTQTFDSPPLKEEKSTMLYVWIALGIVAIIGGCILIYQGKK
jgi:hypothetical protein